MRFERARRDLLRASSNATVTDIAAHCGFIHLGRFSVEYHKRYGEKPSETLHRRGTFLAERATKRSCLGATAHDSATIALTPIKSQEGDEALACGVADEIAMALMRAGLALTSRPEMARYHLRCTLRGVQREVRLTSRLIDAATGRHLWAHCHEGTIQDAFFFEESAAMSMAAAMRPSLRTAEIEQAWRKPDVDLTANDLTLRALPFALALDAEGNSRALDLLGRAINLDPDNAFAVALAAWCHAQRAAQPYLFTTAPTQNLLLATSLARRAARMGGDATVLAVLGNAFAQSWDLETADAVTQKALSVDGGSAWAWSRSGLIDLYKGRAGSALERLQIALDLAPNDALAFNSVIGIGCAHFQVGRYGEAIRWLKHGIAEHPSAVWAHQLLCPAYIFCGQKAQAHRSLANLRRRHPDLTIARVTRSFSFLPQVFCDKLADGLDAVGLRP
jgi:tetratricopeptide (TPR) repeat protein